MARKASTRAMQPLDSLDSDVRYFDGVLVEVEDDEFQFYALVSIQKKSNDSVR
jgi:hypothetical protein